MVRWLPVVFGCFALSSCTSYEPKALEPAKIVADVDSVRRAPSGANSESDGPNFTLALASQWMREHGPSVKEAVAAYETALARAQIATPLPNPGIQAGPQWGFGSDVGPINTVTPFGSIGFSIPLGGRLARQDELNDAIAEVARIDGLARHRELYLSLRSRYTALVIARARERMQESIAEGARQTVDAARQLVNAGAATAVDLALFELEHSRTIARQLQAEQETVAAESTLSEMIGVHAKLFRNIGEDALPNLPVKIPNEKDLRDLLVTHHPKLGRLRAKYEAAERSLRLEVAEQYPDFQFGPSYNAETGERRTVLGLTLGLELPLFDRNQQAIAQATRRREEVRVQYEAAANRALAKLEGAYRFVEIAERRQRLLKEQIAPRAAASIRIARESLSAGSGDAIRFLDATRSQRAIRVEILEAELESRRAWASLEQAVGYLLMTFPSETLGNAAKHPEGLELQDNNDPTKEEGSR